MTKLRTVDTSDGTMERANRIARLAAEIISGETDAREVERLRAAARGCGAAERGARLYVIDRAARLAAEDDPSARFDLIATHLADLEREE